MLNNGQGPYNKLATQPGHAELVEDSYQLDLDSLTKEQFADLRNKAKDYINNKKKSVIRYYKEHNNNKTQGEEQWQELFQIEDDEKSQLPSGAQQRKRYNPKLCGMIEAAVHNWRAALQLNPDTNPWPNFSAWQHQNAAGPDLFHANSEGSVSLLSKRLRENSQASSQSAAVSVLSSITLRRNLEVRESLLAGQSGTYIPKREEKAAIKEADSPKPVQSSLQHNPTPIVRETGQQVFLTNQAAEVPPNSPVNNAESGSVSGGQPKLGFDCRPNGTHSNQSRQPTEQYSVAGTCRPVSPTYQSAGQAFAPQILIENNKNIKTSIGQNQSSHALSSQQIKNKQSVAAELVVLDESKNLDGTVIIPNSSQDNVASLTKMLQDKTEKRTDYQVYEQLANFKTNHRDLLKYYSLESLVSQQQTFDNFIHGIGCRTFGHEELAALILLALPNGVRLQPEHEMQLRNLNTKSTNYKVGISVLGAVEQQFVPNSQCIKRLIIEHPQDLTKAVIDLHGQSQLTKVDNTALFWTLSRVRLEAKDSYKRMQNVLMSYEHNHMAHEVIVNCLRRHYRPNQVSLELFEKSSCWLFSQSVYKHLPLESTKNLLCENELDKWGDGLVKELIQGQNKDTKTIIEEVQKLARNHDFLKGLLADDEDQNHLCDALKIVINQMYSVAPHRPTLLQSALAALAATVSPKPGNCQARNGSPPVAIFGTDYLRPILVSPCGTGKNYIMLMAGLLWIYYTRSKAKNQRKKANKRQQPFSKQAEVLLIFTRMDLKLAFEEQYKNPITVFASDDAYLDMCVLGQDDCPGKGPLQSRYKAIFIDEVDQVLFHSNAIDPRNNPGKEQSILAALCKYKHHLAGFTATWQSDPVHGSYRIMEKRLGLCVLASTDVKQDVTEQCKLKANVLDMYKEAHTQSARYTVLIIGNGQEPRLSEEFVPNSSVKYVPLTNKTFKTLWTEPLENHTAKLTGVIYYTDGDNWDSRGVDTRAFAKSNGVAVFISKQCAGKDELIHHIGRANRMDDPGQVYILEQQISNNAKAQGEVKRQMLLNACK